MREGDHLEDLSADRTIILKSLFKAGKGWIGVAEERDKWRARVNALMNLRVS
jgi:hypothetical protein